MKVSDQWDRVTLGDFVDLLPGFAFKSKDFTDRDQHLRLLRGANVAQGVIDWSDAKRLPPDLAAGLGKFWLEEGDVVLAMDRPWIEAGLKYSWIRKADLPSLLVQRVCRMRGINGLDTTYLRYLIGSRAFTDYIAPIVTGVTVPHISPSQIKAFPFHLPPAKTQRAITEVLTAYDDLIDNNTLRIGILGETAQTIYREWLVNFRYPGHECVPLVDSELGPVPEGWSVMAASEAMEINPRVKVDRREERPFVPMTCVSESSMHVHSTERRAGSSGAKFVNGDTLFARITPCLENGKTAFVQMLGPDEVGSGSTELLVLRGRHLCQEAVYLLARSSGFREHAIKSMSGATGRQRVRNECFDDYRLAVAPPDLMARFVEVVAPMFALSYRLHLASENLRATRDLLLPRLISGEVEMSGLDLDRGDLVA